MAFEHWASHHRVGGWRLPLICTPERARAAGVSRLRLRASGEICTRRRKLTFLRALLAALIAHVDEAHGYHNGGDEEEHSAYYAGGQGLRAARLASVV